MDKERKKQLLEEYKNRKPEMGIISLCCTATGERFLGPSKDTTAHFNSNHYKLTANLHPNKQLQGLWNQYGENSFEFSVIRILKYEDPKANHTKELEKLLLQCMEADRTARRI